MGAESEHDVKMIAYEAIPDSSGSVRLFLHELVFGPINR